MEFIRLKDTLISVNDISRVEYWGSYFRLHLNCSKKNPFWDIPDYDIHDLTKEECFEALYTEFPALRPKQPTKAF